MFQWAMPVPKKTEKKKLDGWMGDTNIETWKHGNVATWQRVNKTGIMTNRAMTGTARTYVHAHAHTGATNVMGN